MITGLGGGRVADSNTLLRMRRFHPGTGITVSPGLSSGNLRDPPPALPALMLNEGEAILVSGHEGMISSSARSWL